MLERSFDFSFAVFLVLFSLPMLLLRAPFAQRRRPVSARHTPIDEFAFEHAIAAYEDLIGTASQDALR